MRRTIIFNIPKATKGTRPLGFQEEITKMVDYIYVTRIEEILGTRKEEFDPTRNNVAYKMGKGTMDVILMDVIKMSRMMDGRRGEWGSRTIKICYDLLKWFDGVSWDMLDANMLMREFPTEAMEWWRTMTERNLYSIVTKRGKTRYFKPGGGLTQGGLSSPLRSRVGAGNLSRRVD